GLSALFGASFLDPEPVEIPDLYLRLPSGEEIPQDPQILRFRVDAADVLAETIDRGRQEVLGPAIVSRRFGRGSVLYIGSSLEAIYEETRMDVLRCYFNSLVAPWLAARRSYEVPYRAGLTPHFLASSDTLILHLLADTGDKDRHSSAREEFLPLPEVRARIRIPEGRSVRSVSLLESGRALPAPVRAGWLEVTVDAVRVHEAIRVDLA
ncbi:MAG TPA: hypothetical protein VFE31_05605, partial [Opitutaceae bacterium]|nr:hypothetical protein [Opitutaceae bacterium]